jgi:hypothetical protein
MMKTWFITGTSSGLGRLLVNGCEKPTLNGGVNQRYEWSRSAERFGNGLREDREALPGASEGARRASADAPDAARFRMW